MAQLDFDQLLTLDLSPFEIRGAKGGITNARSTGILYTSGVYEPYSSQFNGSGSFVINDKTVSNIVFDPPYNTYSSTVFKTGDQIRVISNPDTTDFFTVDSVASATKVILTEENAVLNGSYPFKTILVPREYLTGPATSGNVFTGTAAFVQGSTFVNGVSTSWLSELSSGDQIKMNNDRVYYTVDSVLSNNVLTLTATYNSTGGLGSYTAKKVRLGNIKYQYTKNDFVYDTEKGRWDPNTITATGLATSTDPILMVDGVVIRFSPSLLAPTDPDLVVVGSFVNKIVSSATQRASFEIALPTVPRPESSLELKLNNVIQVIGEDYLINYHQDPTYIPPPPDDDKRVANIMFLSGITDQTLVEAATGEEGQAQFTKNEAGQIVPLGNLVSNSEKIVIDGTQRVPYVDYILNTDAGIVDFVDTTEGEPLVKYVMVPQDGLIDDGIKAFRNGFEQQLTFPGRATDDLILEPESGSYLFNTPLGPDEEVLFYYQVSGQPLVNPETLVGDGTTYNTAFFPIKDLSLVLTKNDATGQEILLENAHYRVVCQSGRIILNEPLESSGILTAKYTPLAKIFAGVTFNGGQYYCRIYEEPLQILDPARLGFKIINPDITLTDNSNTGFRSNAEVIQIKKNIDGTNDALFDLAGMSLVGSEIRLNADSPTNKLISVDQNSDIRVEYKYQNATLPYAPVLPNGTTFRGDSSSIFIVNSDCTSIFVPGAVIRMESSFNPDSYLFMVSSSVIDGSDTKIYLEESLPADVVSPILYVTDSSVTFQNLVLPGPIAQGSSDINIVGSNITGDFRPLTLVDLGVSVHSVAGALYSDGTNVISLAPETLSDYTAGYQIKYSDFPIVEEGTTELVTYREIVEDPGQPAFIVSYTGSGSAKVFLDSSGFHIYEKIGNTVNDQTFSLNKKIGEIVSGINSTLNFKALSYASQWDSSKIMAVYETAISSDTTALVSVVPALRLDGTDTVDFSIENGRILLTNPVVSNQRYDIDYLGRRTLDASSMVVGSVRYFTGLPAGSSLKASFDYYNPDQFYIQVMSELDFLNNIVIPRMKEESSMASGQIGMGIDVAADTGGNDQGGLGGDEYTRQDASIECIIFNKIFDFLNQRLYHMGNERTYSTGWTLLNNDGVISSVDESTGTKSFSRMFPPDNTNMEPAYVTCLTGQFSGPGKASFTIGNSVVVGDANTRWKYQKIAPGDFIKVRGTSKNYQIDSTVDLGASVNIVLDSTFSESSVYSSYVITSKYPVVDDDGFSGPKINGTRTSDFGLVSGDIFDAAVDGTYHSVTFTDLSFPLNLLFPLSRYTAEMAANQMTGSKFQATAENRYHVEDPYGARVVIAARGSYDSSVLSLGVSSAVSKLGFTPGAGDYGNKYPFAEYPIGTDERVNLALEATYVDAVINLGLTDKRDRSLGLISNLYLNALKTVMWPILTFDEGIELGDVLQQVVSAYYVAQEPSLPPFVNSWNAYLQHATFYNDSSVGSVVSYNYTNALNTDWSGYTDASRWALSYDRRYTRYYTRGLASGSIVEDSLVDTRILQGPIVEVPGSISPQFIYADGPFVGTPAPVAISPSEWNIFGYSTDSTVVFGISPVNLIEVLLDSTQYSGAVCSSDESSLNLSWVKDSTIFDSTTILYSSFPTTVLMQNAIRSLDGFDATAAFAITYGSFLIDSFSVPYGHPGGYLQTALSGNIDATYDIISDRNLTDRSNFLSLRDSALVNRLIYIQTRDSQIRDGLVAEELLNDIDGNPGSLYTWANARFNRRSGCESRLVQVQNQIVVNNSMAQANAKVQKMLPG